MRSREERRHSHLGGSQRPEQHGANVRFSVKGQSLVVAIRRPKQHGSCVRLSVKDRRNHKVVCILDLRISMKFMMNAGCQESLVLIKTDNQIEFNWSRKNLFEVVSMIKREQPKTKNER